jgi:DNA adenine methylase
LTDLERAARFLYLQRLTFGGKITSRTFGTTRTGPARFDVTRLAPVLEAIHDRLARVVIECLPFAEFIERYDRAGALFYLDPPYFGCEGYYGAGLFSRDDFERLAAVLRRLDGRFLLSLNDVPEVRRIFGGFAFREVATTYTNGDPGTRLPARELLISGP